MKYKLTLSILVISLFASLVSSAPKGVKKLRSLDYDNNGQVNFDEFSKAHLERFGNLDKDSDGIISKEEFLFPLSKQFEKIDLNSDGAIQKGEAKKEMRSKKKKMKKKRKKRDRNFFRRN